jgi:hypothetical protein
MAYLGEATPRQHSECMIRGPSLGLLLAIKIKSKSKMELINFKYTPDIVLLVEGA